MKKLVLTAAAVFASAALAKENMEVKVNWGKPGHYTDVVVLQCDDAYYSALEIEVPGKPYKGFAMEMNADITDGKPDFGCTVRKVNGAESTKYIIEAVPGCTIRIDKVRKPGSGEKPQSMTYEVHDAC